MINRRQFMTGLLAVLTCTAHAALAKQCDVNADPSAARTFAKTSDAAAWREYPKMQDVPELELDGSESAQILQDKDGQSAVETVQPGEDFWIYTRYCFDKTGLLVQLGFEVRTAWDWGYRLDASVLRGELHPEVSEFFSTKDNKPISRPSQADDIPEALKPPVYRNLRELPFTPVLLEAHASNH